VVQDILVHKKNVYSQFGEDGIIGFIFETIGSGSKMCCEFGAWDGIHFSNCRNLILNGWRGVMIEGDQARFKELCRNYDGNRSVIPVNRFVDTDKNSLDSILGELHIESLDFLSIDIDGLDYQIMESLRLRPRVICVEVNAGHDPENDTFIPPEIAKENIGEPLRLFCRLADEMGYNLTCYNGNAFFVQKESVRPFSLPCLSAKTAYVNFLSRLSGSEREWLYLANIGIVPPYHKFQNALLDRVALEIDPVRAYRLRVAGKGRQFVYRRARSLRRILR